jgi:hypothetical protein
VVRKLTSTVQSIVPPLLISSSGDTNVSIGFPAIASK